MDHSADESPAFDRGDSIADAAGPTDGESPTGGPDSGGGTESLTDIGRGIPAPVIVFDNSGRIVSVNEAVRDRFGYEPAVLEGTPMQEVWPDLTVADLAAHAGCERADEYLSAHAVCATRDEARLEFDVSERRVDGETRYVVVVHDVTSHYEHERRLGQFERVVQTIDDGVYVLDDSFDITMVNDAVESMTGYDREELIGANASKLASEETLRKAAAVSDALVESGSDAASITTTIETADGDALPIETRFSVYQFADGSWGQVGVLRDISDRVRYQETLTTLHDSTRELLHAESKPEVAERIVETATDVLNVSTATVYLYDGEANLLRPAAVTESAAAAVEDLPAVRPDGGPLWSVFRSGERRTDRSGEPIDLTPDVTLPATNATYIPLDEYGVFAVAMSDDDWADPGTLELIDLLAASAESGLERVDREETLRARDRELREQNQRLRRLKRTNETIRRIDGAMVDADSRSEIETAVPEQLVESNAFTAAWIGHVEDGSLVPQSWAGEATGYVDAVDLSLANEDAPPSVRAARSEDVVVESAVADDLRGEPWRMEAVTRKFQSVISIPLADEESSYGVLTVYASDQSVFDGSIRTVFAELGGTIANALRVVETKQWLAADSVVEIELAVTDPDGPLARLAAETGSHLSLEGIVNRETGDSAFARLDAPDADVEDIADEIPGIESVRALGDESLGLFEVAVTVQTIGTTVVDHGGRLRSLTVDDGTATLGIELAASASVREFVDAVASAHGETQLRGRHDRTKPMRGRDGFRAALTERLTERQQNVLRAAYLSGYFEWPRTTTGEEIAESFDVSQPTVNRHLRIALRKCLHLLYEE